MNIVLIGMPGCGKSTIGVLLAKSLLFDFLDTDLLLQNKYGKSLCDIIEENGIEGFKEIENSVLSEVQRKNTVIATGGSAVYGEKAMQNLKKGAKVIYLKLSPKAINERIKNITTRGIAMKSGTSIDTLYAERFPLYEKYADITVDCENLSIEENLKTIIEKILE